MLAFLPSATKLRQGNIFTGVCHSVQGGWTWEVTPPRQVHPRTGTPTGADPGFPVGRVPTYQGGTNIRFCHIFQKNCMKLRKFWAVGGCAPGVPPLDPPLPRQVHPLAGTPPGRYTPRQVHLRAGTPPGQVHLPGRYTPQMGRYPPSRYTPGEVSPRTVIAADGTYPTGMLSC